MSKLEKETRQELIKHSAAIQIENKITLLQRRTWNVLLYHAYNLIVALKACASLCEPHKLRLTEHQASARASRSSSL
jgi:hypothetical protein